MPPNQTSHDSDKLNQAKLNKNGYGKPQSIIPDLLAGNGLHANKSFDSLSGEEADEGCSRQTITGFVREKSVLTRSLAPVNSEAAGTGNLPPFEMRHATTIEEDAMDDEEDNASGATEPRTDTLDVEEETASTELHEEGAARRQTQDDKTVSSGIYQLEHNIQHHENPIPTSPDSSVRPPPAHPRPILKQSGPSKIIPGMIKSRYGLDREEEFLDALQSEGSEVYKAMQILRKRKAEQLEHDEELEDRHKTFTSGRNFRRNGDAVVKARRESTLVDRRENDYPERGYKRHVPARRRRDNYRSSSFNNGKNDHASDSHGGRHMHTAVSLLLIVSL